VVVADIVAVVGVLVVAVAATAVVLATAVAATAAADRAAITTETDKPNLPSPYPPKWRFWWTEGKKHQPYPPKWQFPWTEYEKRAIHTFLNGLPFSCIC
jgi:hypothetical protein